MRIRDLKYQFQNTQLEIGDWQVQPDEHWGIFVAHAHSAELLIHLFSGQISRENCTGDTELPARVEVVSLMGQQQLLEQEIARDETDFQDHIDYGTSVENLILETGCTPEKLEQMLKTVDLTELRHRGFRQLSTGETRRVMLARSLCCEPELLVLHEPYSGLDAAHRQSLKALLDELSVRLQLLVITSRQDELPDCTTHIALFDDRKMSQTMTYQQWKDHPVVDQLDALSASTLDQWLELSQRYTGSFAQAKSFPDPVVSLNQVSIVYTESIIFRDLSWQIQKGQHWQVRGPNGCGKSSLLGLIMGDHPQCYSNDIQVLGFQRGSGESIWDIKRHIGIVSSALHLQYRVSCNALDVLLSGFFDSIGLYESPSAQQLEIARHWLSLLEMSQYEKQSFQQLNYGQQRLLLIVRALIKKPALLILDEPYQGLDYLNRRLVMTVLEQLAKTDVTQLLYVSHYEEDRLEAIDNFVDFVPASDGGYRAIISHSDPE